MVKRLFVIFQADYGALWSNRFHNDDRVYKTTEARWVDALCHVEPLRVRDALNACQVQYKNYAPTLPQFLALCEQARLRTCHRRYVALPKPEITKAQVSAYRHQLRAMAQQWQRGITPRGVSIARPPTDDERDYRLIHRLAHMGRGTPIAMRLLVARGAV